MLNGNGDNEEVSFKEWELLHVYWVLNTYKNKNDVVVTVTVTPVRNTLLTYAWYKSIQKRETTRNAFTKLSLNSPYFAYPKPACACVQNEWF